MKKYGLLVYVIFSAVASCGLTFLELPPSVWLIDLLAPHPGDRYPAVLVVLLTLLLFLVPLIVIKLIARFKRRQEEPTTKELVGKTGLLIFRRKQLQSMLVGMEILIDQTKVAVVDSGKTRFCELTAGQHTLKIGSGITWSKEIPFTINAGQQIHLEFFIKAGGFTAEVVVEEKK